MKYKYKNRRRPNKKVSVANKDRKAMVLKKFVVEFNPRKKEQDDGNDRSADRQWSASDSKRIN